MSGELFSDFKVSKYFTPSLKCKYIAEVIHFQSILSLVFILSHAKLKETNKETSFTQRVLHNVNLSESRKTHKYQNSFSLRKIKKNKTQIKFSNLEIHIFQGGGGIKRRVGVGTFQGGEGFFQGDFPQGRFSRGLMPGSKRRSPDGRAVFSKQFVVTNCK